MSKNVAKSPPQEIRRVPQREDWQAFLAIERGKRADDAATHFGVSRRTIDRRVRRVRDYLARTPGFEWAEEEIQDMVKDALNVYRTRLAAGSESAARDILRSMGLLGNGRNAGDDGIRQMSDEELVENMFELFFSPANPGASELFWRTLERYSTEGRLNGPKGLQSIEGRND